jgi:hypothetical protein
MGVPVPNPQTDPVLLPFLTAPHEEQAQLLLAQLLDCVSPAIDRITRRGQPPNDAFQETMKKLVNRLRTLRSHPDGNTIGNFDHYVKVVAKHTVSEQLREDHSTFRSVADSLRYVLRNDPRFGVWEGEKDEELFGLAIWRDQQATPTRTEKSMRLLEDPASLAEVLPAGFHELSTAGLIVEIFDRVGHPVRFDRLVSLYRALKPVEVVIPIDTSDGDGPPLDLPARERKPDEEAEFGEFLSNVWTEIKELLLEQRIAYLLNFTAGDGRLDMFPAHGAATIRNIGAALELSDKQFCFLWSELRFNDDQRRRGTTLKTYDEKFALLWQHLPLADNVIAGMLGVKRQYVINLRKAAGDRLSRRLVHHRKAAYRGE